MQKIEFPEDRSIEQETSTLTQNFQKFFPFIFSLRHAKQIIGSHEFWNETYEILKPSNQNRTNKTNQFLEVLKAQCPISYN